MIIEAIRVICTPSYKTTKKKDNGIKIERVQGRQKERESVKEIERINSFSSKISMMERVMTSPKSTCKCFAFHALAHRYLIEVDCCLGQFKSAKLKDREGTVNGDRIKGLILRLSCLWKSNLLAIRNNISRK